MRYIVRSKWARWLLSLVTAAALIFGETSTLADFKSCCDDCYYILKVNFAQCALDGAACCTLCIFQLSKTYRFCLVGCFRGVGSCRDDALDSYDSCLAECEFIYDIT